MKFPKSERLSNQTKIQELFSTGDHFNAYPLKVIYLKYQQELPPLPNQMLVTVPKRNFRRAVDRNKLKRRVREAYRLNKHLILSPKEDCYLLIGYIYIGKEIDDYQVIEKKLKQSLLRLNKIIGS